MLAANRTLRLAIYALLAAILYLPGLGRPALWEPDEGRYAEIAREMVISGDYVTPRDDFELYFEKPPLVYWAEAAAIQLFGVNEFAVRLPAALFSIGQVVVTAALAEAMLGASAGLFAALALAMSPLFFGFARFATLDPALAFFLTAALAAFYVAARDESFSRPSSRRWMLTSAAMLALGTLAKGPIALLLGGAIALAWMASERRLRQVAQMPLVWCFIIYGAIVVPWFVLAEARNPGFIQFFIVHEHLERYVASSEHGWGPWFFIPIVIGGTWPWIFFVPLGWSAMRADDGLPESAKDPSGRRASARFLVIWFIVILVFFSIPRSKLGSYILPALPPLGIVAGYGLARMPALGAASRRRLLAVVAIANLAIAAVIFVFSELVLAPINPGLGVDGLLIGGILAAGAIAMYSLGRASSRAASAIGAIALAMVAVMPLAERLREDASSISTYRNLARTVEPYLAGDCTLASYRHYVQSLPFYTRRRETRVEYWGELSEFSPPSQGKSPFLIGTDARLQQVWSSGACMVLIANDRDREALADSLKPAPAVIGCEGKKLALYNGALAPPPGAADCRKAGAKN
ncbi:MAG: phospholipid carrier-dependent glycosyltransferase [Candidatus Binatus sp.]|jgi:4-amino-4-deoxy-L-arabinose transferase-like glycosyltransferase|uniref:glycosyltransferase family 39 protein n=1 Tax=Candidatus Binatus sp. TaxID=2811406 RepID=UPI003D0A5F98